MSSIKCSSLLYPDCNTATTVYHQLYDFSGSFSASYSCCQDHGGSSFTLMDLLWRLSVYWNERLSVRGQLSGLFVLGISPRRLILISSPRSWDYLDSSQCYFPLQVPRYSFVTGILPLAGLQGHCPHWKPTQNSCSSLLSSGCMTNTSCWAFL